MAWLRILILLVLPAKALSDVPIWDLQVEPSPRLGLAFPGSDPQYYDLAADLGIGVVRVSAAWSRIEPNPGAFRISGLDRRIAGLQALGLDPFVTFESDAAWGADYTDAVKNGTPRDIAQWTRFVARVVDRYDGDGRNDMPGLRAPVRWYQVANEFLSPTNRSGGWAGRDEDLISYINATHDAVKSQDADALFVLGGVATFNADIALQAMRGAQFTVQQRWSETSKTVFTPHDATAPQIANVIRDRFVPALQNSHFDVASVHLYGPEERDVARLSLISDVSRRPVISSECGGPSLDYDGRYSGQAHYAAVLHRNLNVWAAGSTFCLWFGLGESVTSTYGNARVQLYDRQGRAKPGTQAYRLLARIAPVMQRVTAHSHHSFEIQTTGGPIWVAIGHQGLDGLNRVAADTPAICVNNADRRDALQTTWGQLGANCEKGGVALGGEALLPLLEAVQ